MKMTKNLLSMLLAVVMVLSLLPAVTQATDMEALQEDTVYMSVSYDGVYKNDQTGKPMAYVPVSFEELESIDLTAYGLENMLYDADGDGNYETTALQLIIYAHENLWGGDWADVTFDALPGSSYFSGGLFGQDENLNYYLNGAYPLDEALTESWGQPTGATSDHIVLKAGDYIDLAGFSCWSAYGDYEFGFRFFADANYKITHAYTAEVGTATSIKVIRGGASMGGDYSTAFSDVPNCTVYYGTTLYEEAGSVETDADACASITFPSAGTWYVWTSGGNGIGGSWANHDGCDYMMNYGENCIVSAPAYAAVTVTEGVDLNQEAADSVIAKINGIGTVDLSSEAKITEARAAYTALTDTQKALVDNYNVLTAAEARLAELQADKAAADTVVKEIDDIGGVSLENETAINAAWDAYNGLTAAQQGLVTNLAVLQAAQQTLTQLKNDAAQAAADQAAADGVVQQIEAIDEVSLEDETAIQAARTAYTALTNAQKALVTNYSTLTAAEEKLAELKADKAAADEVVQQIEAIGEVSLEDETAIQAARTAYTALTDTQKALVTNYSALTAAETKLAELQADQAAVDGAEETITAIGNVTVFSAKKIQAARAAYDALTDAQKASVKNLAALTAAESALVKLYKQAANADHKAIYETTGKYIAGLGTPGVGSTGGEWMIIDLIRAGQSCPEGYYTNVEAYVKENINDKQQLHKSKGTDNSRVILALTAAGYDVTNVAGHNLLMGLTDMNYVKKQGINGPIWSLIAFDSHDYEIPANPDAAIQVTREKLIAYILNAQLADGGWALSGTRADADITGMAVQALTPYYNTNAEVKTAVDKALICMSDIQHDNGGFGSIDGVCTESCAQVVVALTTLGIDPETDPRFVKNGISVLDAMCLFAVDDGGFAHVPNDSVNGMATEQGQYALVSYFRFKEGKRALYDMSDVILRSNNTGAGKVENNTDTKENAYTGTLDIPAAELADKLLTKEEETQVASGVNISIELSVEDIGQNVSATDKALIEKALDKNTVGLYLEITLTKQLGDAAPVKITETNGAVTVTVVVPENLRNTDAKVNRTYKVVRVHEGKTDILDAAFDATTGKLSFQTDCFSTYAVVYTDTPVLTNPETGDNTPIVFFTILMVTSVACLAVLTLNKTKYAK